MTQMTFECEMERESVGGTKKKKRREIDKR